MDEKKAGIPASQVEKLVVSASPHVKGAESVKTIMWNVNLALLPVTIQAIWNFGLPAIITFTVSIVSAVAAEALIQLWQKKPVTVSDGSAVLTGLLLAMCLPPNIPWYMTALGSVAAIGVAKHMFGGLGNNVFNPALVGRAVIMASFPAAMTTWGVSGLAANKETVKVGLLQFPTLSNFLKLDAVTSATPLEILKQQGYEKLVGSFGSQQDMYLNMFFGNKAVSSLGETSAFLLILGGLYLIIRGYIKWQVPVVMIGTVGLLMWIFGGKGVLFAGDPVFHMMAGGVVIGAFFMATDMVTIPVSTAGQIIFAAGAGALTVLIRLLGGYPEGVCYAILLMNAVTPLIDRLFVPKKFGSINKNMLKRGAYVDGK